MAKFNISIEVNKEHILGEDISVFLNRIHFYQQKFKTFDLSKNIGSRPSLCGTVILTVSGYHQDSRELYEIPEVKNWFKNLIIECPHLFYFIDPNPSPRDRPYSWLIPLFVNYEVKQDRFHFDQNDFKAFFSKQIESIIIYTNRIGENSSDAVDMVLVALGIKEPAMSNSLISEKLISKLISKAKMAPLLVEVEKKHIETLSSLLAKNWAPSLVIDCEDPSYRTQLSEGVKEGLRVVLKVVDANKVKSFLPTLQYVESGTNYHVHIADGFVKINSDFEICCLLQSGISNWGDDWRNKMNNYWLYHPLKL